MDFQRLCNRTLLHKLLNVPVLMAWGRYLAISLANKICINQIPENLSHAETSSSRTRNNVTRIISHHTTKIGQNNFVNRIGEILMNYKSLDIIRKIMNKINLKALLLAKL